MADTVLPPTVPTEAEPMKSDARPGNSNDKSWAGWAISSFTNKIATANGEIEPTVGVASPAEPDHTRSASVPRPAKSSPSTQLELPKHTLRPNAQPLGRSMSDRPPQAVYEPPEEDEGDDVFDAWGAMDDDEKEVDPFTAAVASPSPSSPDPSANKSPAVPYDDGGEPDFAGWLAAKSQAKTKKPLPKGLGKAGASSVTVAKATLKPRVVAAPAKKIDIKPKDEDGDDGWGDAWD